jgi:hypothetical protein
MRRYPSSATFVISAALVVLANACSGSGGSPTPPSSGTTPALIAGDYSGTISDSIAGSGALGLSVTQSGNKISGQFADTFSDFPQDNTGSIAGTVTGSSFTGSMKSILGMCRLSLEGSVSGTTLSGTFSASSCSYAETGTFSVAIFTPPSIAGTYSGTEVDAFLGNGTLTAIVTESGSALSGSYSSSFGTSTGSGTVFGQFVNTETALFALQPPKGSHCPDVASAAINPPTISGTFRTHCGPVADIDTFTLAL